MQLSPEWEAQFYHNRYKRPLSEMIDQARKEIGLNSLHPKQPLESTQHMHVSEQNSKTTANTKLSTLKQHLSLLERILQHRRNVDRSQGQLQRKERGQKTEKNNHPRPISQEIGEEGDKENVSGDGEAKLKLNSKEMKKLNRAERRIMKQEQPEKQDPKVVRRQVIQKLNSEKEQKEQRILQPSQIKLCVEVQKSSSPNRKQKTNSYECLICFCSVGQGLMERFSPNCSHTYCQNCLNQHAQTKIKQFKQINCPCEECPQIIDIFSPTIQNLPQKQKEQYYKIVLFSQTTKHGNKLCPNQTCNGFIIMNKSLICCVVCHIQYCQKCMMKKHSGQCEDRLADFLQYRFRYRRCNECKFMIEEVSGCKPITCRCGNYFCYQCGEKWVQKHLCWEKSEVVNKKEELEIKLEGKVSKKQNKEDQKDIEKQQALFCTYFFLYLIIGLVLDLLITICCLIVLIMWVMGLILKVLGFSLYCKSWRYMQDQQYQGQTKVIFICLVFPLIILDVWKEAQQNKHRFRQLTFYLMPLLRLFVYRTTAVI